MLRITPCLAVKRITVVLEGKLTAAWLPELHRAVVCAQQTSAVQLDLAGLHYADQDGIQMLRALQNDGVDLAGASRFIQELLGGDGDRA